MKTTFLTSTTRSLTLTALSLQLHLLNQPANHKYQQVSRHRGFLSSTAGILGRPEPASWARPIVPRQDKCMFQ